MLNLENQYKIIINAYLGMLEMDEYSLKAYALKEIESYKKVFLEKNKVSFDFSVLEEECKNTSLLTKLQDCLYLLKDIYPDRELDLLLKKRIRELEKRK